MPAKARATDRSALRSSAFFVAARLERSPHGRQLRAFVAGCRNGANARAMKAACEEARALPAGDDAAARAFFERAFIAYAVVAPDGTREGLVTGY